MTFQQLQQLATDRAQAERLHTFKIAGNAGYIVKSRKSEPGSFHRVLTTTDGSVVACDCKGWQYRNSCTHAAAVSRRVERDHKPVATTSFRDPFAK